MPQTIDIDQYLNSPSLPTLDVRSPGEYARGHIPGALNLPLFDDQQRAEVGTTYKQAGRIEAIIRGMQFAGKNADSLVQSAMQMAPPPSVVVHCWRGGMRSEAVAWLLRQCQYRPQRIQGGYKAYRRAAHAGFHRPQPILIIGGLTGSGKTELLGALRDQGEQVIDLEALARHRGSAFGSIGQAPQPTVEQFENDLFEHWRRLDPTRPVWMEGESKSIGRVYIPQGLWEQMLQAPEIIVDVPRPKRVEFLVHQYGDAPVEQLAASIDKIKKRLGGDRHQAAHSALAAGDLGAVANISLDYYDRAYSNGTARHPRSNLLRVSLPESGREPSPGELRKLGYQLLGR